jgi:hypothetical protein
MLKKTIAMLDAALAHSRGGKRRSDPFVANAIRAEHRDSSTGLTRKLVAALDAARSHKRKSTARAKRR